jgi:DNA-binding response OmpR family regulator
MDRRHECLDAGADEFFFKPFRPSEMLARIGELIHLTS